MVVGTETSDWEGRVITLVHVKVLLEQSAEKWQQVYPEIGYGFIRPD